MRALTAIDPDAIAQLKASGEFFWLDLTGPSPADLERLRGVLHVAPPPEHEPHVRRRLYAHRGDHAVLVFKGAHLEGDRIAPFEVIIYVSGDFIVSYHDRPVEELDRLRERFARRAAHDEQLAVARVLDAIADSFMVVLTAVDDDINELQDNVIERPRGEQLSRIAQLQRELHDMRRLVNPERDMLQRVADEISDLPGLEPGDREYISEVARYLSRISDQLDNHAQMLTSATDIYLSRSSNDLNVVMKRLTVVATVFLPLTFITGFFGQNFAWLVRHVASATTFVVWGLGSLVLAVGAMVVWFRRGGYL